MTANEPGPGLARLLLEHRDGLFGYILALVRNWSVAEELFQEVSLVVLEKGREGVAVERFGAWSREIARRMVLNYWKTTSRTRLVLSDAAIDSLDRAFQARDESDDAQRQDQLRDLRQCVKGLPDHLRQVVELRYHEALPLSEIARRLNRSAGSVQVALSRVRQKLLECSRRLRAEPGAATP
jgi:RNA polymerase sigma-70 factor